MTRDWFVRQAGSGFPLMLLHGLGASSFSWRGNIGPLSRHYQILAPELPPTAAPPPARCPILALRPSPGELLHRLDDHGAPRAVLMGNSLGGSLALLLAHEHPERFPALVLLAPALAAKRLPLLFYPLRLPVLGAGLAVLLGPWTARAALHVSYHRRDLITPEVIRGYTPTFRTVANRLGLRRLIRAIDPMPLTQAAGLLCQLRQPVCLIWGEQDRVLPLDQAFWLQRHLSRAELHVLPKVGHAPQEEAPDLVNEIIIAFLARSLKN